MFSFQFRSSTLLLFLLTLRAPVIASASPVRMPYEEAWPAGCAKIAAALPRVGGDVMAPMAVRKEEPVRDLKRWKLRCVDLFPVFELVVTERGEVRCARILSLTHGAPPKGLYAEVRGRLMKLKFRPATLNGKPIAVVMDMIINYRCQ